MELGPLKVSLSKKVIEARELDSLSVKAWDEVHSLQKAIWIMENDLHIGDDVEVMQRRNIEKGRITDIIIEYADVRPVVHKFKKDGSVSSRQIYIWDNTSIKKLVPHDS